MKSLGPQVLHTCVRGNALPRILIQQLRFWADKHYKQKTLLQFLCWTGHVNSTSLYSEPSPTKNMLVRLNFRPADAPGGLNTFRDNWLYTPNTTPQTLNRDKLAHAALFILLNARGPAEASGILSPP